MAEKRKILFALDGSDPAFETIRYVSRTPSFQNIQQAVLFSVFSKVPECYWDVEMQGLAAGRLREVRAWVTTRRKAIEEHLAEAKQALLDAGFPKGSVVIRLQERKSGTARDILMEARKGYAAVLIGRRGMSRVKDLVLGSTTTKLLQKLDFAPLLLVGKNPQPERVLIAMDASEGAMRAVDCVASLLGGSDLRVALLHVVRCDEKEGIAEAEIRIEAAFDAAKRRLEASGIVSRQISTSTVTHAESRAAAIVKEAAAGFGTIVVGRRGMSMVREFLMGRVSHKVVQLARENTVWVVS